jgi:hypothetical protein
VGAQGLTPGRGYPLSPVGNKIYVVGYIAANGVMRSVESLENRDRYDYYGSLAMTEKEAYPSPIGNQILLSRLEAAPTEFGT